MWFIGGLAVAFLWVPIMLFIRSLAHGSGAKFIILAFAPLLLEAGFFIGLFSTATTVR
jgi:hypothetical protein